MSQALAYKDIYLVPKYSELKSRSEADVSVELGGRKFKLPIMPANMVACIDDTQAKYLSENGYFYVRHRFDKKKDNFWFCHKAAEENWKTISISIGVKREDYILVENLSGSFGHIGYEGATRCDFITIDIAHGHSEAMKNMIEYIHGMYKWEREVKRPFIIAGNVTTAEAVKDLVDWGADAVKVGIGGGGACSTKNKTGFHVPMFSAVLDCVNWKKNFMYRFDKKAPLESIPSRMYSEFRDHIMNGKNVPIIADGGIRENADIAKALVAGAHMVMAGSIFAGCKDSPAENVYGPHKWDGRTYTNGALVAKKYFGSASAKNKGFAKNVEGLEIEIPCNGMTYAEKLTEIEQDLQSAVSYAGGKDLSALREVEYIEV